MTIYALDLESSGLDFWSPNFVLKSLALAWEDEFGRLETRFYDDMDYIEAALDRIKDETILVYNASFDIGVIRALFPHLEPKNWIDVMRLRQLRSPVEKKEGYGLKAAVKVFLPGMAGYEQKYYEHLKTQFPDVPAKKLGKHLGDLPRALLAEYNTHDTKQPLSYIGYLLPISRMRWGSIGQEITLCTVEGCLLSLMASFTG